MCSVNFRTDSLRRWLELDSVSLTVAESARLRVGEGIRPLYGFGLGFPGCTPRTAVPSRRVSGSAWRRGLFRLQSAPACATPQDSNPLRHLSTVAIPRYSSAVRPRLRRGCIRFPRRRQWHVPVPPLSRSYQPSHGRQSTRHSISPHPVSALDTISTSPAHVNPSLIFALHTTTCVVDHRSSRHATGTTGLPLPTVAP